MGVLIIHPRDGITRDTGLGQALVHPCPASKPRLFATMSPKPTAENTICVAPLRSIGLPVAGSV
jgi:hypothetical protein